MLSSPDDLHFCNLLLRVCLKSAKTFYENCAICYFSYEKRKKAHVMKNHCANEYSYCIIKILLCFKTFLSLLFATFFLMFIQTVLTQTFWELIKLKQHYYIFHICYTRQFCMSFLASNVRIFEFLLLCHMAYDI